jgi:hypothetical protein
MPSPAASANVSPQAILIGRRYHSQGRKTIRA